MYKPNQIHIFRIIHIDNLHVCLQRKGLYAPNLTPKDELTYRNIHNTDIQLERKSRDLPCGPKGVIHDYVPFYFGYRSPMLLQLKTGRVENYSEGQEPIIYLVSTVQAVIDAEANFIFSDGHGIAAYTTWYYAIADLDKVDWDIVNQRYWADSIDDGDRQRRKQAEFLVHKFCNWEIIKEIGVINARVKSKVEEIIGGFPDDLNRTVRIQPTWYY
ncbi:MAG: DUF4433 domain-containing protein [Candidatus Desulfatibia sp.]|uniref:type II toxin-antitoxin system toxin DNA ADP-ribosyl transferase DarT n=1 Tax=Candidatus Desulfatibia sp. TaxID=3101189 RepID=UPI002F323494